MAVNRQTMPAGLVLIDIVVLIAMAITATAFAAGLVVHSRIEVMAAAIAASALFMVMASSHFVVTRSARSGSVTGRLNDVEQAIEIIDTDLQRIDQVEDDVARLDLLTDRVERLDLTVAEIGGPDLATGMAKVEQLSNELKTIQERLESLRGDLEDEARTQRSKITTDLKSLETLITQLSRELMGAPGPAIAAAAELVDMARPAAAEPLDQESIVEREEAETSEDDVGTLDDSPLSSVWEDAPDLDEAMDAAEEEGTAEPSPDVVTAEPIVVEAISAEIVEIFAEEDAPVAVDDAPVDLTLDERVEEDDMIALVREAIDRGRIDLHLQPIVRLRERTPLYYEAYSRLRTHTDAVIMPGAFMPAVEEAGMVHLIDNVALVKSVQVLRRLGEETRIKGIFCNASVKSLLDSDFFPELVEFLEENASLSESLTFELPQPAIMALDADQLGFLDTLGALGFRFSLDHVADLDVDFAALRARYFRFIKINARTFLSDMEQKAAALPSSNIKAYLDDYGLKLIVEKVEDEETASRLLDYDVELAEGYLFGAAKPAGPAFYRELEEAGAA